MSAEETTQEQEQEKQEAQSQKSQEGSQESGQKGDGEGRGFKLEDLPPAAQEAIKERDRLKEHHETLLDETKQEREKRQRLEREQEENERKRAEENGEYQKLYQKTQEQLDQFQKQVKERDVANDSLRLASQVGVDDGSVQLLSEQIEKFANWKEGEIEYFIDGVKVSREQVTEHISQKFPRLVKGSGSTGGGATGSQGGAQTTGKVDGDKSERAAHFRQKFGLQN